MQDLAREDRWAKGSPFQAWRSWRLFKQDMIDSNISPIASQSRDRAGLPTTILYRRSKHKVWLASCRTQWTSPNSLSIVNVNSIYWPWWHRISDYVYSWPNELYQNFRFPRFSLFQNPPKRTFHSVSLPLVVVAVAVAVLMLMLKLIGIGIDLEVGGKNWRKWKSWFDLECNSSNPFLP